jgi:hypothetical protein
MLTFKKFLFCLQLETGVSVIGFCGIFSSLILGIAFLLTTAFCSQDVFAYINERFLIHHNGKELTRIRKLYKFKAQKKFYCHFDHLFRNVYHFFADNRDIAN